MPDNLADDAEAVARVRGDSVNQLIIDAPQAGFDDTDFYPDVYDKAAVLACRIA